MRFRTGGLAVGVTFVSCTYFFAACGGSDDAKSGETPDGSAATSSGASGSSTSSSGSSTSSSGSTGDDDDGGTLPDGAPIDSGLVPVGDGGVGTGCNVDTDCASKVCATAAHECVVGSSCRASDGSTVPGVDTCGSAATHDSCCSTLTLPTTKTRTLDKYEITSGRIRAFVEAVKAQNAGVPNIRKFAKDFAAAHPGSQLDTVVKNYPAANGFDAYIDLLPNDGATGSESALPIWLGAFPADAMNAEDGCYVNPTGKGGYGASTYWQDPATLKVFGIGDKGVRKYPASVLDTKPQNCTPPIILAAFCAWDGGELAQASDYHEVYGTNKFVLGTGGDTVYLPWTDVVPWSQFNWRNGHDGPCPKGWPGCVAGNVPVFFSSPAANPAPVPTDDDTPEIAEPGRFAKDVTKAVSPDGSGWFDIGGNLLEAAWPDKATLPLPDARNGFCDTSDGPGPTVALQCSRAGVTTKGTVRFKGDVPAIALVGYSFEVHDEYGQKYFADATPTPATELTDLTPYAFPLHFQYGKLGGRCARVK